MLILFPNAVLRGCRRITQQNPTINSCTQRGRPWLKACDQLGRYTAIPDLWPFKAQQKLQMCEDALARLKKYGKVYPSSIGKGAALDGCRL